MKMFGLFGGKKKNSTHQMSADTKKRIQQLQKKQLVRNTDIFKTLTVDQDIH